MSGLFNRPDRSPSVDDTERFSHLYADTSTDLLAFLLRRCPTADDAADCLAETYRIAWEKRGRIPAGSDARPWLFGVARNVARQDGRSGERRAATARELALVAEQSYTAATSDDSALAAALSDLSPLDQEIVTMLAADGLAPRDVASVLGLSPNAVRIRAHRARVRLRTLMAGDDTSDSAEHADSLPAVTSNDQL
jgi:RNA polymerase sigma-70 factor (ECF subfamily)